MRFFVAYLKNLKNALSLCTYMVLLVVTAACSREEEIPTSVPLTAARGAAEIQPQPTETIRPNATSTLVTLAPTFTPISAATPNPTPTLTPVTSVVLLSLEDFGDDRNPLTGEIVDDPSILQRRPIAVKISNAPAKYTRPQSGLSQADLVFEHVTEGPITRFTAIIYGETPPKMGPIRSARLIDLEIPVMYDAALAYSGSSIGVSRKLFSSDFASRILRSNQPGYYRTGEDKPYEHTLYTRPEEFWPALELREQNTAPAFSSNMAFSTDPPVGGETANSVHVKYGNWTEIDWRYDEESGRYFRWADGEKHLDANNGEQISASNVMLLFVPHQLDTTICEYQSDDRCLAHSTEIHIWGKGSAILLRDGQQFEVNWNRPNQSDMLTFQDDHGLPVPLKIGNTWFQIIPLNYPNPYIID